MKHPNRVKPNLEMLEDRLTPSLTIATDSLGNLNISGTPDFAAGNATQPIVVNETSQNVFNIFENGVQVGGPMATFFAPNGVSINFSQSSLNDNVTLNFAAGTRINGNLYVNTGIGADTFSLGVGAANVGGVGGNVTLINTDSVLVGADTIGGSFTLNSVVENNPGNIVTFAGTSIGGNASITQGNGLPVGSLISFTGGTSIGGSLTVRLGNGTNVLTNTATDTIGGSFTFVGGNGGNSVILAGTVGRSVTANLGNGTLNLFTQDTTAVFGSNLTVIGGLRSDSVTLSGLTAGSVFTNLGQGDNFLNFTTTGSINGGSIAYIGGVGADSIDFNGTTNNSTGNFQLGAGDDTFNLGPNTNLSFLFIDFGPGVDTFGNFSGATQPRLLLKNLP
jgi:hypothetical protein